MKAIKRLSSLLRILDHGLQTPQDVARHPNPLAKNVLKKQIEAEWKQAERLKHSDLVAQVLGDDWRLQRTAPSSLLPSPIRLLALSDPEYKKTMALVPAAIQSRVVQVRAVNGSSRTAVLQQEQMKLNVQPSFPFLHGTPEQWHATAIAMNGFTLSIRLHGRASGNGVYSAITPQIPRTCSIADPSCHIM